jgi:hypothetical protein
MTRRLQEQETGSDWSARILATLGMRTGSFSVLWFSRRIYLSIEDFGYPCIQWTPAAIALYIALCTSHINAGRVGIDIGSRVRTRSSPKASALSMSVLRAESPLALRDADCAHRIRPINDLRYSYNQMDRTFQWLCAVNLM